MGSLRDAVILTRIKSKLTNKCQDLCILNTRRYNKVDLQIHLRVVRLTINLKTKTNNSCASNLSMKIMIMVMREKGIQTIAIFYFSLRTSHHVFGAHYCYLSLFLYPVGEIAQKRPQNQPMAACLYLFLAIISFAVVVAAQVYQSGSH